MSRSFKKKEEENKMTSTIESYDFDLELCTSIEELSEYLDSKGKKSDREVIEYLEYYMGVRDKSSYDGEPLAENIESQLLKEMFLDGSWRAMTGRVWRESE